ncbi:MAG: hypothetical protein KAZ14_02110 [Nitrosomonas sp.]|jgi:hypothetical protein|nr:hypothetical protein [Nitrosomonas sp.]
MLKRVALTSTGGIIFIIGLILFPMPVPLGIPIMIIGLSIILKGSNKAKRLVINLIKKNRYSNQLWRKTRDLHKRIRNQ